MIPVPNFTPAVPEIFLAISAMVLLLLGVSRGRETGARTVSLLGVAVLAVALVLVLGGPDARTVTFSGLFVTDGFARFMKTLILIGSALSIGSIGSVASAFSIGSAASLGSIMSFRARRGVMKGGRTPPSV